MTAEERMRERAAERAAEMAERRACALPFGGAAAARQVGIDTSSAIRALPLEGEPQGEPAPTREWNAEVTARNVADGAESADLIAPSRVRAMAIEFERLRALNRKLAKDVIALATENDRLRAENAALREQLQGGVVVPREPTEEMIDAPRQIILYSETPGRTLEGLRAHLARSGVEYLAWFPVWATRDCGHLTKAAIAILIYCAMLAAAKEKQHG